MTFSDDDVKAQTEHDTGVRPPFALEAFGDVEADVRRSMVRIHASPFIPHKIVRGLVSDVATGKLTK